MAQQDIANFLHTVFGKTAAGKISLWCLPAKESIHLDVTDLDWVAGNIATADLDNDQDVYFGVALRGSDVGPTRRGSKADCVTAPCLWVDIDVAGPGHAASNLPPTFNDAVDLLSAVPFDPTCIVDSGGGLHAYWVFEKPVDLTDAATGFKWFEGLVTALQRRIINAASQNGWHVDSTTDVTRVLRAPGTMNRKVPSDPRPCYVVEQGAHVRLEDVCADLGYALPGSAAPAPVATSPASNVAPAAAAPLPGAAATPDVTTGAALLGKVRERLRSLKREENRDIINKVLKGQSFGAPGQRDSSLQKVASIVAFVEPDADPSDLAELLRPSLDEMQREAPAGDPAPTVEDAAEKIARAQVDARRMKAERTERETAMRAALIRSAQTAAAAHDPTVQITGAPYTDKELEKIAKDHRCTVEDLSRRWIIQHGTAFYVLCPGGRYKRPLLERELDVSLPRDLAPAPVEFYRYGAKGQPVKKSVSDILADHATVARQLRVDLTLQHSYYDAATETFHEAACPLRLITPKFDPVIQEWLERLGGSERDRLLDWVATVTRLDMQTAALYLSGPPGTGKTLLATGLARLWSSEDGPSELEHVLANFNDCLTRCPLVFADEHLPTSRYRGQHSSAELRRLVGSNTRTLSRKFLPTASLNGALRFVLAANNEKLLAFDEDLSVHDLEAVAGRFLHIDTSRAAGYLAGIGGRQATDGWVDGDKIAAHALWLRDNRKVAMSPDGRFLVQGSATRMHRLLATKGRTAALVVEWLAKFLDAPPAVRHLIVSKKVAIVGNGELLVNTNALTEFWDLFVKSDSTPNTTRLGSALGNLAIEQRPRRVGSVRFHAINLPLVYDWAEANQIGDIEQMKKLVALPVPVAAPAAPAAAPATAPAPTPPAPNPAQTAQPQAQVPAAPGPAKATP